MSASDHLSPGQFFHGTTHNIPIGGKVLPADMAGKSISEYSFGDPGDMSEGDHAFAIRNDENYAWHAAMNFHRNGRRPRVYEVEPAKDMKPGPWNAEHPNFESHMEYEGYDPEDKTAEVWKGQDEWASKTGFPVRKRIDTMPGRQGTFPEVNWYKYKGDGPTYGNDANHPTDTAIQTPIGEQRRAHQDQQLRESLSRRYHVADAKMRVLSIEPKKPPRLATLFD